MEPDWPLLTLSEADQVLRRYPQAGRALKLLSFSPRPFSAGSVLATPRAPVFLKRHHKLVRSEAGLLEEHRLISYLTERTALVHPVLADVYGQTVVSFGEWTYEVHGLAQGVDIYEHAISWTPFLSSAHAQAAGRALAEFHLAVQGYDAPARNPGQLVTGFSIFGGDHPLAGMEAYLEPRPLLKNYLDRRNWRDDFDELFMPAYRSLSPWLKHLIPLWTHNDLHASNLTWSGPGPDAVVTGIIDFGLADRTNAIHDIATAIERNIIEWLRIADPSVNIVHFDHLDALLKGYEELHHLGYVEAHALVAMLPLVHCEFALSEADYFLSILQSEEKAFLAYEGYFLEHARWFQSSEGSKLLAHLGAWAARVQTTTSHGGSR